MYSGGENFYLTKWNRAIGPSYWGHILIHYIIKQ